MSVADVPHRQLRLVVTAGTTSEKSSGFCLGLARLRIASVQLLPRKH
jgi:hypothetical protein